VLAAALVTVLGLAAAAALQAVIIGMALAWAAKQRFIAEYARHAPHHWWRPVLNRTVDLASRRVP